MSAVCATALVLLLDASGSIQADQWRLQLEGTALAIEENGHVMRREGGTAIMVVGFSDYAVPMVPWRVVASPEEALALANDLRAAPRFASGGTDMAQALRVAVSDLERAPCGDALVIDVATDGEANGPATQVERDRAMRVGIRINGIVVGHEGGAAWMRQHAMTPDGFVIQAETWMEFAASMRRKLALEIASR